MFLPQVDKSHTETCCQDQSDDHKSAVKEEFIRKDLDYRIGSFVKNPVVIGKHDFMEQNESIFPV